MKESHDGGTAANTESLEVPHRAPRSLDVLFRNTTSGRCPASGGDGLPSQDTCRRELEGARRHVRPHIVDEEVGEGAPAAHPAKSCRQVSAADEVVAAWEIFAPGAAVPKFTAGRVLAVGARARVVFRIAGAKREITMDVAPADVCSVEDLDYLMELERRLELKGPGPGGYSIGLQVLAATDIRIGGVARVAKSTKGIVKGFVAEKQRVQVAFQDGFARHVRINVKPSEIEVDLCEA